jgi:hypothetical protein
MDSAKAIGFLDERDKLVERLKLAAKAEAKQPPPAPAPTANAAAAAAPVAVAPAPSESKLSNGFVAGASIPQWEGDLKDLKDVPISDFKFGVNTSSAPLKEQRSGKLELFGHALSGGVNTPIFDNNPANYYIPPRTDVTLSFPANIVACALELRNGVFSEPGLSFDLTAKMAGSDPVTSNFSNSKVDSTCVVWNGASTGQTLTELRIRSTVAEMRLTICKTAQKK